MYFSAGILVMNDKSEILAVSRKDDKEDFGLPFGKVEPGETPIEAALRELLEETGYGMTNPQYIMIYHAQIDGRLAVTYEIPFNSVKQVRIPTEGTKVAWIRPDILANGKSFGEYNRGLLAACGIRMKSPSDYYFTTNVTVS